MIFSQTADLVRSGEKTQTRRPRKSGDELRITDDGIKYIYNTETNRVRYSTARTYAIQDGRGKHGLGRIRIVDLRIEKLLDISAEDAIAEGILGDLEEPTVPAFAYYHGFLKTWSRLYPKGTEFAVEKNPDVIVIVFERCEE